MEDEASMIEYIKNRIRRNKQEVRDLQEQIDADDALHREKEERLRRELNARLDAIEVDIDVLLRTRS